MELRLNNISFKYKNKIILEDTSYSFKDGKIYGLLGRNGAGKTTFFNILCGLLDYRGTISLDDKDLNLNKIGYIKSVPNVPEFLTGEEYLKIFFKLNNFEKYDIDKCLKMIDIKELEKNKLIKDYSHGMKNKLELLINILMNNKIFLLDEPLTNLDLVAAEEFKYILNKIKKDKIIILSTHIMDLALDLCDEIVILNNKKIAKLEKEKNSIIKYLNTDE